MRTHPSSRAAALRRYTVPVVAVITAAALTSGLVPGGVAAAAPAATSGEHDEYPPPTGPGDLSADPEIQKVVDDAQHAVRYSFAVVAADPSRAFRDGSIEEDLREGLLSMPEERRQRAGEQARDLLSSPERRKAELGRYAAYEPEEYVERGFEGTFDADAIGVDKDVLSSTLVSQAALLEKQAKRDEVTAMRRADALGIPHALRVPTLTSLDLRVDRVTCVDETDPEPFGGDEILLGGVKVHSDGVSTKVPQSMVHDDFDDGESVAYPAPGRLFSRFDLTAPGAWPRSFTGVVMIAEEDGSGFADAITTVWEKVKEKVKTAIEGFVAGVLTPYVGAAIAAAIGKAVAWLTAVFFGWLLAFFEDDLFAPGYVTMHLPNRYEWMYRNPANLGFTDFSGWPATFTFTGHGGRYTVNTHWQVNP